MRKLLFLSLIAGLLMAATASAGSSWFGFGGRGEKGSGNLETIELDLKKFTRIKSYGAFDVIVEVGKKQKVTITFDDNLLDNIEAIVSGRTLKLGTEESFRSRHQCRVEITVESLEFLSLSGSGDIEVINLDEDSFTFRLSGSGELKAEGKAENLDIRLSGSGDVDTRSLIAKDVEVSISGSGDVRVYAENSFDGHISGSGDISYYGDPEHIDTSVSGSGNIKSR